MTTSATEYNRKQRLVRDSFDAAAGDMPGLRSAMIHKHYYDLSLKGRSAHSLRAAFRSVVNLVDPPRYLESFDAHRIAAHPAFARFRDRLNENGMDISTQRGHYHLHVINMSLTRGQTEPLVRLEIVPWDGVKKPLEPFDFHKHMPKPRTPALFY